MTTETWLKEFLPEMPGEGADVIEATAASLAFFKGFRKENLIKHGLIQRRCSLVGTGPADFIPALRSVFDPLCTAVKKQCRDCPLREHLGRPCATDSWVCPGGDPGPWDLLAVDQDPEPLIEALTKTLEDLKDGQ